MFSFLTDSEFDVMGSWDWLNGLKPAQNNSASAEYWPSANLRLCGEADVFRWFVPREWGGQERSARQILQGYVAISSRCLATAFILTQRSSACRKFVESGNRVMQDHWLPGLAAGTSFTTVGISHLSTSRRHLDPVLQFERRADQVAINGFSPWVTGAPYAEVLVIGATDSAGNNLLFAVESVLDGIQIGDSSDLIALSESHTAPVRFEQVVLDNECILTPGHQSSDLCVPDKKNVTGTGGLPTSALALGLAGAALEYISDESRKRKQYAERFDRLRNQWLLAYHDLIGVSGKQATHESIRQRSNSLALRCTQSALAVAKGAGFTSQHPVGRWCQQALFFLVWSCPQPVVDANLDELVSSPTHFSNQQT